MSEPVIPRRRIVLDDGIIELVAWRVQPDEAHPEGIKYSFTYIRDGERICGIDNYNREGHHKHVHGNKEPYDFISLEQTLTDFKRMVEDE